MSIDTETNHLKRIEDRLAQLEARHERMIRHGTIPMQDGTDVSDPTKPRFRIQHGKNSDGTPALGPWLPWSSHAGTDNNWKPPSPGQQVTQFAPDGIFENGTLIPFTGSTKVPAPETDLKKPTQVFGKTRRTLTETSLTQTVGGTQVHQDENDYKVTAPGKVEIAAGDPSAANSSGFGSLMNSPHELNRIVQGAIARLDQHDHLHAAHHDQMSQIVDLAIPKVPALIALQSTTLNHKPEGLQKAADQVTGQVPMYAMNIIQQAVSKLLASPLGGGMSAVQPDIGGTIAPLIGQLGSMVGAAGLSGGQAATAQMLMTQVQSASQAAASGGTADIDAALTSVTSLLSGSPMSGAAGDLVGQIRAAISQTSGLLGGLSGLMEGQVNGSKGTIKSALFGGY